MTSKRTMLQLMLMKEFMAGAEILALSHQKRYNPKSKQKKIETMDANRERKILDDMERLKHEYNIKGIIIRARNRKTALKIYNLKYKKI